MKSFEEINKEKTLGRFLASEFGTMYFQLGLPKGKNIIIKHLDSNLPIEYLPTYEHLYNSIIQWMLSKPSIQKFVFIPNLIEVGIDYIIRPFYSYHISFRHYYDKNNLKETPEIFDEMRTAVLQELDNSTEHKSIIHQIIRKSLLEPTAKTYFNYRMNKFIIVEPKISLDDLFEWKEKENSF